MAQVGHGELANRVDVVHVARRGKFSVVSADGLFGDEVLRNVVDVVAVVGRFGPECVARLDAFGTRLRAVGQRLDLHAGVVVIKLAPHLRALRGVEVTNRIAQRRLPAVADMQRAGRVGRDEFDDHFSVWVGRLRAVQRASFQHFAHGGLFGGGLEPDVDEAWPGNFNGIDPAFKRRSLQQQGAQGFCGLARVLFQGFGQLHGRRAGKVAMCGDFGRLEGGLVTGTGRELIQRDSQGGKQVFFNRKHGRILRSSQ